MAGIKDQEHIDDLRRRLYERGSDQETRSRHRLTPREIEVSRGWSDVFPQSQVTTVPPVPASEVAAPEGIDLPEEADAPVFSANSPVRKKRRYRTIILVASVVFFAVTALISSTFLFFGTNQISAKNISLTVNAPLAVAGGEVATFQATVANQNTVDISSATLIINYPSGTRSTEEGARELYEERIALDVIAAGETINVPFRSILYGEENEDKEVKVAVEYRVEGSNGTFFKEAETQVVKITSSPLVVGIVGVEKISAGQEIELTFKVQSNTDTVQHDVLVSASYPDSFSFSSAEPEVAYGQNSWLIEELAAKEVKEIVVRGKVVGAASESGEIKVQVGNPQLNNQFMMDSVLSQAAFSYTIDQPFTGVVVEINGDADGEAILSPDDEGIVKVVMENTLPESMYDVRVEIKPTGNLIRDDQLVPEGGFYDASEGIIRYEVAEQANLAEVFRGDKREFKLRVLPDAGQATASFSITASVYAKRSKDATERTLIGTGVATGKYASEPTVGSELGYGNGPFKDTGGVPPVVGQPTTYTVTLVAEAGANDLTGTVVTATFPQHVSWLDQTKGDGAIEYNPTSKQLRWNVGDVTAERRKSISFQISLTPTSSQIGKTVVIMSAQELRATDRFTGSTLRATQKELINELSTELGFARDNGEVQAKGDDD